MLVARAGECASADAAPRHSLAFALPPRHNTASDVRYHEGRVPGLSLPDLIARWQAATLTERSAAQQHFLDLCHVLGQPTPASVDQAGTFYTFEKGVTKTGGGQGFADVWLRGHFAWEYKGKH